MYYRPGRSSDMSQKGSMVVEIPLHIWHVTSDCQPPVNIWSIIHWHGPMDSCFDFLPLDLELLMFMLLLSKAL